jgi:hypothetical protein
MNERAIIGTGGRNDLPPSYNVNVTTFVYVEKRLCLKLYVFLKSLGLAFYTTTLTTCYINAFFICMLATMALALLNSIRYEYAHFKKYGTVFASLGEFEKWKMTQWPRSTIIFSLLELIIKIGFIIRSYPLELEVGFGFGFHTTCHAGQSIFKIHVLGVLILYTLGGIFVTYALVEFYCCRTTTYRYLHLIRDNIPMIPINIVIINAQNECCICLDKCDQPWTTLPCGHAFHEPCISHWLLEHQTCPICRFNVHASPL